jgi:hypothetical protein
MSGLKSKSTYAPILSPHTSTFAAGWPKSA